MVSGTAKSKINGVRQTAQAAWSSAPHIQLLMPQREAKLAQITVNVTGDLYHYDPAKGETTAVIDDSAGSGGKGEVLEGPRPIKQVILHTGQRAHPFLNPSIWRAMRIMRLFTRRLLNCPQNQPWNSISRLRTA